MARGKKQKTVTLVTPSGVKQQFGIQHAERLLGLGPALNGGWTIDPNSDYRNAEDAVFLAKKLERLFGMEQDPSLDLEARLWRASNLDALVQALGGIVKATNEARANLPEEMAKITAKEDK